MSSSDASGVEAIPLRALLVEDSVDDAALIVRALKGSGYAVTSERVESAAALREALLRPQDIVICDYNVPGFNAPLALDVIASSGIDVPVIIVSGTIGEDVAVEMMRAGARDYLLKDNLKRLSPAVRRELREAEERKARREAERALEHAQKLESIGMLAGGIAHDFNNVLTCIIGGATLARRRARGDAALQKEVDEIIAEAHRGAGLVRQLLAFSRRQPLDRKRVNLNDVVSRLEGFFRRVLGAQIEVEISVDPRVMAVSADFGQVEQVLTNLCINARDAMPKGGLLRIETRNAHVDEKLAEKSPNAHVGKYVRLSVADGGTGIPPEVLEHIFDPFFTTKPPGQGTGLGLSVVYGIVTQHGGFVDVQTESNRGTRIDIYFPALPEEAAERGHKAADVVSVGGLETILLVEDDPGVRSTLTRALATYGYSVVPAATGEDAWRLFCDHGDEIRLVLLDIVMPKVNGRDLYEAMKALRDDVNVLFISGQSEERLDTDRIESLGVRLLRKPFRPDDLALHVRQALDERRAAPRITDAD